MQDLLDTVMGALVALVLVAGVVAAYVCLLVVGCVGVALAAKFGNYVISTVIQGWV